MKEDSKKKPPKRLRPISLHPLTPEQALSAFMATPVKKSVKKKPIKKNVKKKKIT